MRRVCLFFGACLACLAAGLAAGRMAALLVREHRTESCLVFDEPKTVLCSIEGTPLLSEPVNYVCSRDRPDRYTLEIAATDLIPAKIVTILGGECVSVFDGDF